MLADKFGRSSRLCSLCGRGSPKLHKNLSGKIAFVQLVQLVHLYIELGKMRLDAGTDSHAGYSIGLKCKLHSCTAAQRTTKKFIANAPATPVCPETHNIDPTT